MGMTDGGGGIQEWLLEGKKEEYHPPHQQHQHLHQQGDDQKKDNNITTNNSNDTTSATSTITTPTPVYIGEYNLFGQRHGSSGEMIWDDGNRYVGTFENNLRSGQGTFFFKDGKYTMCNKCISISISG
jgi:hypothetical protein